MSVEGLARSLSRRLGGAGTTRWSFLRIHVWAVVFLVGLSTIAPAQTSIAAVRRRFGLVESVTRGPSDQRAFYQSPYGKKQYFHVAWIMGSEGDVLPTNSNVEYLASHVRQALPQIGNRPVVVDMYYFLGMLPGDDYFSLLDALAAKPDMIVMSLNPLFALNPLAVHQWTQLDARAALDLATKPREWPIGAAIVSPSDLAWGFAQAHLKVVAQRTYWSSRVHRIVDTIGPLDRSKRRAASARQKPDAVQKITAAQPQYYWFHRGAVAWRKTHPHGTQAQLWSWWLDLSNHDAHPLNSMLLRAIGSALKASGIPSYVYLAQVNDSWLATEPAYGRALAGVERQIAGFSGSFDAPNIRFQPKSASRLVPGLTFLLNDPIHLRDPAGFGAYIAHQLCAVEHAVKRESVCVPTEEAPSHG